MKSLLALFAVAVVSALALGCGEKDTVTTNEEVTKQANAIAGDESQRIPENERIKDAMSMGGGGK
ncbi:MAG TPA: hypothetical protein PLL78_07720 [Fimbriimonadaceae bacterium]|nr:hypothetical protein [Fimbriimonadaceae bacterium]HRJ96561.1 hypothetical protein [Fimbriimonadaceae bacterium]